MHLDVAQLDAGPKTLPLSCMFEDLVTTIVHNA